MSNRFATISLIVIVSILSAGIFFVIGLFLFPGINMFGLRYIGPNTHKYSKKVVLTEMGKFSNIVVNTYEVPIEVVFSATPELAHKYSLYTLADSEEILFWANPPPLAKMLPDEVALA